MKTLRFLAIAATIASSFVACADDAAQTGDEQNITLRDGGEVEMYRSQADGEYRFRLKAGNGQIIAVGESYQGKAGAMSGVETFLLNAQSSRNFKVFKGADEQFYWRLEAGNDEVVASGGEGYSSEASAKRAVNTVVGYVLNGVDLDNWADMCGAELYQGGDEELYFRVRAANGQIIVRSEGYTTEASAKNGIDSVIENGASDARYELKEAQNGSFYFNLKAGNGQVIATSGMYQTEAGAENGIEVLQRLVGDQGACRALEAGKALECSYSIETPVADTSYDLDESVVSSVEVTNDNFAEQDELAQDQIRAAVLYHTEQFDNDAFIDGVDDGYVDHHQVTYEGTSYDWVEFALGDTEVGVIFADDSLKIVALVGDGDIYGCE